MSAELLIRQLQGVAKVALPFASGWGNYGTAVWTEGASYSRFGRLVVLQGLVTKAGGAPAATDVIATLPVGFRPAGRQMFVVVTGNTEQDGRVDVLADGTVVWMRGSATETDYTSLSGIAFVVDAD